MEQQTYDETKNLKNKEEFDLVLGETSLKNYLKVSAYASGERSRLEKSLSGDMFYKSLYAHSEDAERYIEDLKSRIKYDDVRNIVLSGYKGCGKTTFIHYYVRRLCMRHLFLNFDRVVNYGQEIRSVIASYIYKNIREDCLDKNCAIIEKFLAIYDESENNFDFLENEIDNENKFKDVFLELATAKKQCQEQESRNVRKSHLNDNVKICLNKFEISQLLLLIVMWDVAERECYGLSSDCMIVFDNIDMIYNTTRLPEFTQQVALFRNNADRLFEHVTYNGNSLGDPSQIYICVFVMRETTKAEFMEHFQDQRVSLYVPIKGMSNLYSIHEIVKCRGKYLETLKMEKGHLEAHCEDLYNKIKLIDMILEDKRASDEILGLFNHDFRTCFEVLSEMNFDDGDFFTECERLKNTNDKGFSGKPAFRCLVYRAVFNLFQENSLFSRMRSSDFQITVKNKTYAANLDRFILLFLSNSQSLYASEEDRENEFISLKELFSYFLRFFDASAIVNAIWDMYEMRKTNIWNHLVTDEMNDVTKDQLSRQIECFINKEDCKYGKIRITVGGRKYVETLLPHFEYFAARVFSKNRPSLFRFSAENLANTSLVTSYISSVRQEEEICCEKLKAFYMYKFKDVEDFRGENFLKSKFAWKKLTVQNGIIMMFHNERIVHAHIGYLDTFRKYAFYKMDCVLDVGGFDNDIDITEAVSKQIRCNGGGCFAGKSMISHNGICQYIVRKRENDSIKDSEVQIVCRKYDGSCVYEKVPLMDVVYAIKVLLNYKLVNEIQEYIDQLNIDGKESDIQMYSFTTKYLVGCYNNCIEKIKRDCYSDFRMNIDRQTGVKIGDDMEVKHWKLTDGSSEERRVWDKFEEDENDMSEVDPIEDNLSM